MEVCGSTRGVRFIFMMESSRKEEYCRDTERKSIIENKRARRLRKLGVEGEGMCPASPIDV